MVELFGGASWIAGEPFEYGEDDRGYYEDHPNHVVSCSFDVPSVNGPVMLNIAVLGYARVLVNGRALPGVELLGHWTRFDACVYADAIDVSGLVRPGKNELRIELGNGFYNPAPITLFGKYNLRERLACVGTPAVLASVTCAGACLVASGPTWMCVDGSLLFNNPYLGERRVLKNAAHAAANPRPVTVYAAADAYHLEPNPAPLVMRAGECEPVCVTDTPAGAVLDFGKMVEGVLSIDFLAAAGQQIELRYAEVERDGVLHFDPNLAGLVGVETPRGMCPGGPGAPERAYQRDVLTCAEGANSYTCSFTYHSFRYVEARGLRAADIVRARAIPVHNAVRAIGAFTCDSQDFMALLDAAARTKLNNMHDVLEDCSRERFGYGGDMIALSTSNAYLFDMEGMLDKTLADMHRDQTERGGIPETAPFMGIGSNGPAYGEGPLLWQVAYPYLACAVDRVWGRRDLLEREWDGIRRFGDYLLGFDAAELAAHCLGDHGSISTGEDFKSGTPDKEFTGWCAILWGVLCVAEAAERLGERTDAERYVAAAEKLRAQIRERFGRADGLFGEGSQTALAFAGMLGLGDAPELAEKLARAIEAAGGVFNTGIFGTMLAFELLGRCRHNDVIESWLTRCEEPSLLSMLAAGSGALAEQFYESMSSYDHAMFSSYAQWFYQGLAGIRVADDARGCDKVEIAPYFSHAVDDVACSWHVPAGELRVAWRRLGRRVHLEVTVPQGVNASCNLEGVRGTLVSEQLAGDTRVFVVEEPAGE